MSYAVILSALLLGLAFIVALWITVRWVRRPVSARRMGPVRVPLFSHQQAGLWSREDEDEGETAAFIAVRAERAAAARTPAWSNATTSTQGTAQRTVQRTATVSPPSSPFSSYAPPVSRTSPAPAESDASTPRQPGDIRYTLPTDSTLQVLPGRLAVVGEEGEAGDKARDIRFVRLPGETSVDVTFGRAVGAPYRHVQLTDATVSRQHARLSYRDGAWWLANLSATNPVLYNGVPLTTGEQRLTDGDRIDMGEVGFRFHA